MDGDVNERYSIRHASSMGTVKAKLKSVSFLLKAKASVQS